MSSGCSLLFLISKSFKSSYDVLEALSTRSISQWSLQGYMQDSESAGGCKAQTEYSSFLWSDFVESPNPPLCFDLSKCSIRKRELWFSF